jgi:hypothetical protein
MKGLMVFEKRVLRGIFQRKGDVVNRRLETFLQREAA